MRECRVLHIDGFTQVPGQGNPAGVVLNGDDFTEVEMQQLAKKIGFNETVFICSSKGADHRLRYFTPGYETPLCGHATMGAIFALYRDREDCELTIETGAGILPISYRAENQEIEMRQARPQFIEFQGNPTSLCASLGIEVADLHPTWPIQYGNTGSWTLLVPLREAGILDKMSVNAAVFPQLLEAQPRASVHPFAPLSISEGTYYGRHFSSPYAETAEDSVTGTASGVMGAYLLTHVYEELDKELRVYQGKHVNREGLVQVKVTRQKDFQVSSVGTACFNRVIEIKLG